MKRILAKKQPDGVIQLSSAEVTDELRAAIAELQAAEKHRDPGFAPKHDYTQ